MRTVWSFGITPLANSYLTADQLQTEETTALLEVGLCQECHLAQLRHDVDPAVLFSRYLYVSSTSPSFVRHFSDYAERLIDRFRLTSQSLVIDIGSNDGILLKPLRARGINVLGIEPAANIAAMANQEGIETIAQFITPQLAQDIVASHGAAQVITANNVFAHTPDLPLFVNGVKTLLDRQGVFVFEVQYLGDLLAKNLFDVVYHEHMCYYHLHPLMNFFAHHGLRVFDVERPPVHGGSLRVYVESANGPHPVDPRVGELLRQEKDNGLNTDQPFHALAKRLTKNKTKLTNVVQIIKAQKKRIVGYGAPAKATTFMYAFGLDGSTIDYIVDDDKKIKQGLYMPGTHIPIVSPDRLYQDRPDYCLILAWNFADAIIKNNQLFLDQGGTFIIPVPEPRLVDHLNLTSGMV